MLLLTTDRRVSARPFFSKTCKVRLGFRVSHGVEMSTLNSDKQGSALLCLTEGWRSEYSACQPEGVCE